MPVTYTTALDRNGVERTGKSKKVSGRMTLTGTYVTGGFTVTPNDLLLGSIDSLELGTAWTGTTSYNTQWDSANSKIKLGWTAAAVSTAFAEIANATTTTNFVIDFTARGR
jgi:hypothetical protein